MWIQIIAVPAFILFILSFWQKDKKKLLLFQIFDSLFYTIHYALLGATSGAIVNFIGILRAYIFSKKQSNNKIYSSNIILYLFILIYSVSIIVTSNNIYGFLPLIATILYTIVVWKCDADKIRIANLFVSVIWFSYDLIVMSYVGMLSDAILFISTLFSILSLNKKSNNY